MMRSSQQLHQCIYVQVCASVMMIMICYTNLNRCHGYTSNVPHMPHHHRYRKAPTAFHTAPINFIDTRRYTTLSDDSSIPLTKPTRQMASITVMKTFQQSMIHPILVASFLLISFTNQVLPANAAPPFAVIAEELGYYPIMVPTSSSPSSASQTSTVQYVAKRVQRPSTQQAIDLAHYMRTVPDLRIILAGTYWCSHTTHQKELFGVEAWNELNTKEPSTNPVSTTTNNNNNNNNNNNKRNGSGGVSNKSGFTYIECAPQGYRSNPTICANLKIDGYPTWIITTKSSGTTPKTTRLSGERSLYDIANAVGYTNTFDASIEDATNPPPGIGSAACK